MAIVVKDIIWTKRSLGNIEKELEYYGNISKKVANDLSKLIIHSVNKIAQMSGIGREGKIIGVREFVLQTFPYIIVYRVRNNLIEILTIIHQKRKNIQGFY